MNHNLTIGSKLKALRTSKKYTLKQLSEESGLSIGFLSQIERGMSSIAIDSLSKSRTFWAFPCPAFSRTPPHPPPIRSCAALTCPAPRSAHRSCSIS